jgi:hypothetical protein
MIQACSPERFMRELGAPRPLPWSTVVEIVAALAVAIILVLALISWRIDKLPARLFTLVKNERARDDGQSQAIMMEAAALKVGPLIAGIRSYHEQMEASLRAQLAEAETRARISERRAADASTYMDAASALVAELRVEIEKLTRRASTGALSEVEQEPLEPDQRATVELRRNALVDTQGQGIEGSLPAPSLPDQAAMMAARLIPRTPSGTKRQEPPRSPTRFDLPAASRQEATRPPPPASTDDPSEWSFSERPSDPEGERTRVGARPSPESLALPTSQPPPRSAAVAKVTLLSMPALTQPASRPAPAVEVKG